MKQPCWLLRATILSSCLCKQFHLFVLWFFFVLFFLLHLFFTGSWGLYFPQTTYSDCIYVGQAAGTPVLQVHAMQEKASEQPYFCLYWRQLQKTALYASWFHIDAVTGMIYMNKTLDWTDFESICEFKKVSLF